AGDAKASPKADSQKYFTGVINILDKNIDTNHDMLNQVRQEKESVKLALLHGKEGNISAADNIAECVKKLAEILDKKYNNMSKQKWIKGLMDRAKLLMIITNF